MGQKKVLRDNGIRGPNPLSMHTAITRVTTLYLIRHGSTKWNQAGRIQGHLDIPLSKAGLLEAAVLADALAEVPFKSILSSDLRRAVETARIIAAPHDLDPIRDPRLRERDYGRLQGLSRSEVEERFPVAGGRWGSETERERALGIEAPEKVAGRGVEVLTDIATGSQGRAVAVVSHGGLLRAALSVISGLKATDRSAQGLGNCSVSVVRNVDGRWDVVLIGGTACDIRKWHQEGEGTYS